jgi:hypothetical protein
VYDYCEFSMPGEQGGRWTWASNRPMVSRRRAQLGCNEEIDLSPMALQRSIDGLRFDTVQMALIEHRQPKAPDVV